MRRLIWESSPGAHVILYASCCVPAHSYSTTKPTNWPVRPAKTQISLGIRPVWPEPSLCAQWVAKDPRFLHAGSEVSYQTRRMPGAHVILQVLYCWGSYEFVIRQKKRNICVFQVSRPYLGFCPDPKHFIVNWEQNVVKFAGKWGKIYWKMQFLYKIFWQNKMLCRPTIPIFFGAETWNTYIHHFFALVESCKVRISH